MRPTIPLAEWRLAVNLAPTRAIADVADRPAAGCDCPWCRNWAAVHARVLPPELREELARVGVEVARPTDLYPFGESAGRVTYRVTYHGVGRILAGPPLWSETAAYGPVRRYEQLREAPDWIGLSVAYQEDVDRRPGWATAEMTPLVQIDLRLHVPWALNEPRPSLRAAPPVG